MVGGLIVAALYLPPAAARDARMLVPSTHQRSQSTRPPSIQPNLQGFQDAIKGAILAQAVEATIDGLPVTVATGNIAPCDSGSNAPKDAVEYATVALPLLAFAAVLGQQGFDQAPLRLCRLMTTYCRPSERESSGMKSAFRCQPLHLFTRQNLVVTTTTTTGAMAAFRGRKHQPVWWQ